MNNLFRLTAISLLLTLTACGGSDTENTVTTTSVSQGQELMDLQRAFSSGVITQQEFEIQRKKILDR